MFHALLLAAALANAPSAASPTAEQAEARRLLEKAVSFKSSEKHGETAKMAQWLASEFRAAGFAKNDIEIVPAGKSVGLIVRYRGAGAAKPPVLFLAHMDVVEAERSDWDFDPFVLTENEGRFYARGVSDNKLGIVNLLHSFIRLKREKFVPSRDLILAFSGDEETAMETTKALVEKLKGAEFAFNSDAGGGFLGAAGRPPVFYIQTAEKTYATFEVTAKNSGGHSSEPRADNAIYDLADALRRIEAHAFPVMWSDTTLRSMRATAQAADEATAKALLRFADKPGDRKAAKALSQIPWINPTLRTTCVATMLKGGHAENALPQTATATVNCRIFPGVGVETVRAKLAAVMANPKLEIAEIGETVASPESELRPDVEEIVAKAVRARHPDAVVVPYMESGASDGMYFRGAGVPTFGAGAMFQAQGEETNIHGKNESIGVTAFYDSLDHWVAIMRHVGKGAE